MDLEALRRRGLAVETRPFHLLSYRRDLWPRATLMLRDGVMPPSPGAVTWPESAEQVGVALKWASDQGVPVVPYGAGSGVCGGAAGLAGSLVIDMKRMNRLVEVDHQARTARVESGMLGQHLEDQLMRQGLMTAHSPSSIMTSTVGGWVAARSAGQFSSRYGVFDDMLLGLHAETPAGPVDAGVWTPQGHEDLISLFSGSEGTLGVVTEALVRVAPVPETRWLRGFAFRDLPSAWDAMRRLLQAGLWPSVLRLYDPVDTRLAGKTKERNRTGGEGPPHPLLGSAPLLNRLRQAIEGVPALRHRVLDLPMALPGLINRLAEGLAGEVLLILGFEGPAPLVAIQVKEASRVLDDARDLGAAPGERWFSHRHHVSYKLAPLFIAGAFADTMEVAAPWSRLRELHDRVREALGRHAFVMAHFSHAYPEGCSIYFSFTGAGSTDIYDAAWADALQAAAAAGGTVTHHHGVGQLKAGAATLEAGPALRVWREVKGRLDPQGILNPGRLYSEVEAADVGPPPPTGGPLFSLEPLDRLAWVDPDAEPASLEAALDNQGHALRIRPDRPIGQWLRSLERGAMDAWEVPLFGLQARFPDGTSVRLQPAPRSAAGPDLRWGVIRRAKLEMVQVPVRPCGDLTVFPLDRSPFDIAEARPAWRTEAAAAIAGPTGPALARCFGSDDAEMGPARSPTNHRRST
jgi:alkyldihydroxyacetonephosphate synthase